MSGANGHPAGSGGPSPAPSIDLAPGERAHLFAGRNDETREALYLGVATFVGFRLDQDGDIGPFFLLDNGDHAWGYEVYYLAENECPVGEVPTGYRHIPARLLRGPDQRVRAVDTVSPPYLEARWPGWPVSTHTQ